jgi:cell division protein ZapA
MAENKKVKIKVCGYEFIITSEESEEYVRNVGEKVNSHISKLINFSGSMSTTMASIFTAMEFGDDAAKAKRTADNLRQQLQDFLEAATIAKSEAAELRRREHTLQQEVNDLKKKLAIIENRQGIK